MKKDYVKTRDDDQFYEITVDKINRIFRVDKKTKKIIVVNSKGRKPYLSLTELEIASYILQHWKLLNG